MSENYKTVCVSVGQSIEAKPLAQYAHQQPEISPRLEVPLADLYSQYDLVERFAEGGFSVVSVAQDKNLGRFVAVKTLKTETGERASFISEAKTIAQLDHPAILPVYALMGDQSDGLHLCMKLVSGRTLREHLRSVIDSDTDSEAAIRERVGIFLRVCDAVSYAHARDIIHGDIKPENIVIGEYGEVYVVDWGLARKVEADGNCKGNRVSGTPNYFAPETLLDGTTGKTSEVYTLGVVLRELISLQHGSPARHIFGCHLDAPIVAITRKATAYEPCNRYDTAAAFADDLRRYLAGASVSALPDSCFVRFARWCSRRRKECVAGVLAVLLIFAAITAAAIFRQLQATREMHDRSRAFNYLNDRTATVAAHLDLTALQIQEQLLALARICAYLLDSNTTPPADAWQANFRPSLSEIGKSEPGMIHSPYYQRLTAMDYGIYQFAPDADREKCVAFMRRTSPALRKMRNIVLGSMSGYNFDPKDYERLKMAYLYRGFPVRSVFIGTTDGLKLLYPWRGNYPRKIYPHKREWYKAARDRRAPVWGKPYMDFDSVSGLSIPCSVPIIDFQDNFRGVVGLDLSLNKLTERILSRGNVGDYVIEKAVISRSGETVFSSKSKYFNAKFDPEKFHENAKIDLPLFATPEVRDRILNRGKEYGTFIVGKEIYSFAFLETFNSFFVVVADYDKLTQHVEKNGK